MASFYSRMVVSGGVVWEEEGEVRMWGRMACTH